MANGIFITIDIFQSFGLSLCGLVILIVVIYRYLSKSNVNKKNKLFLLLLLCATTLCITSILYPIAIAKYFEDATYFKICNTICTIDCMVNILIIYFIALYIDSISKKTKVKNSLLTTSIILAIGYIIAAILIYKFDLNFVQNEQGFYAYQFKNEIYLYICAVVPFLYCAYVIIFKGVELTKSQLLVLIFTFLLIVIILIYQAIFKTDFNAMGFLSVFIVLSIYFTVESQDSNRIISLTKSKEEAEFVANDSGKFINLIFDDIAIPMNAITVSTNILKSEHSTDLVKDFNDINISANRLERVMNLTKIFSSIQNNELKITSDTFSLQSLITTLNDNMNNIVNETNNHFNIKYNHSMPSAYKGDYKNLMIILNNVITPLLDNEETGYVDLSIDIKVIEQQNYLSFTISSSNKKFNEDLLKNNEKVNYDVSEIGYIIAAKICDFLGVDINISEDKKTITFEIIEQVMSNVPLGEFELNGGVVNE